MCSPPFNSNLLSEAVVRETPGSVPPADNWLCSLLLLPRRLQPQTRKFCRFAGLPDPVHSALPCSVSSSDPHRFFVRTFFLLASLFAAFFRPVLGGSLFFSKPRAQTSFSFGALPQRLVSLPPDFGTIFLSLRPTSRAVCPPLNYASPSLFPCSLVDRTIRPLLFLVVLPFCFSFQLRK